GCYFWSVLLARSRRRPSATNIRCPSPSAARKCKPTLRLAVKRTTAGASHKRRRGCPLKSTWSRLMLPILTFHNDVGSFGGLKPGRRPAWTAIELVPSESHLGVHIWRSTRVSLFECRGSVCHCGMHDAAVQGQRVQRSGGVGRVATRAGADLAQLS